MKLTGGIPVNTRATVNRGWLHWLNLRPEESERTLLMFAFYTATSIGILWLEVSAAALFLGDYGANSLPWIYIASAGIGTGLGFLYSWLQQFLPLRRVIVLIAVMMALPLFVFRIGLNPALQFGFTVFLMRLWLEAIYVLNELNTSITANQLFNIREIKRTYPLISSGVLAADILSGFSLPLLQRWIGLSNVILMACLMLLVGSGVLFYLSQTYQQFFPDSLKRRLQERQPDFTMRRLRGSLHHYFILIVMFFVMAQVLSLLIDFQYLSQLEQYLNVRAEVRVEDIANFLALFSGTLGIFELLTQWFVSGRIIERLGVFAIAILPPVSVACLSLFAFTGVVGLFWGLVLLKFVDELLRYTLVASIGPVLFQPIPDSLRSRIQSIVRGIAEPISSGLTGVGMLVTIWILHQLFSEASQIQPWMFLFFILMFALVWLLSVVLLRSRYLGLLVMSAERGDLSSLSDIDLRTLKRAIADAIDRPVAEAEKKSCIELLTHIDPKNVGEVLSPLLTTLPSALQRHSLEAMLDYPNPAYLPWVQALVEKPLPPEVLAVALRYIWLTEPEPNINELRPYLEPDMEPVVRGTAASLMLRRGQPEDKAIATQTLRRMLTHKQERERVMGCRALGEAVYLQTLRIHIEDLLQDESLRVRCALLEAIAATHLEEYYPSLIRGLNYKSTREAAMRALIRLDNEAIPLLVKLAEELNTPELVRTCAWTAIAQVGTLEAHNALVSHLMTAWGSTRRSLLRILLKLPHETGIDAVLDLLGRSGVETLINQELLFIGQIYATLLDISPEQVAGREADLLRRALRDLQNDAIERVFLLMRFLYPSGTIQAAAYNLQSESPESVARGLEILDNTLDIPSKRALLSILDRRSDWEKLQSLSEFITYQSMQPSQRLRHLLELRYFLSDWSLACCFHLARQARWSLTAEQAISCLHHVKGFVREAVLSYLRVASPRTLSELLPLLKNDPDRLVAAQVQQMLLDLSLPSSDAPSAQSTNGSGAVRLNHSSRFDPT
ncbi:MFS transporter [Oculatella sp. LEGE 06141]|uniref:MFS transporter n=1 Tax=Oculatella sp. LEGE 06141 TaxID=1828648 RepID=UPI00188297D8|nr:MFS transporter [Oculatella sp. LEGE 06141]MBE9183102.1 MFS transporter [Oculatella sp. LEGE 06141]